MRHGLYLPNFGAFADPVAVSELAATAEGAGWDGLFVWDHVQRHEGDLPVAEPWVLLAAVAARTTTITLGPLVTPLPRRRPWNVARAAVTLDHLSGGRMVLGVGLGSARGPELGPFGEVTDPVVRGDMLDEGLEVVRGLWSGEPVTHRGTHYTVEGQRFLPTPVRPGGIPLWAATESTRGRPVRRAARLDGVFPIGVEPEDLSHLMAAVAEAGRPPDAPFAVVVTDSTRPRRWAGTAATWWLRQLDWDRPLSAAQAVVAAGV